MARRSRATQLLLEERDRARPGQLRRRGVIARRGVVVEAVLRAGILEGGELHAGGLQLARDADVFLCEASWTHSPDRPPKLHLSGTEAGRAAAMAGVRELLLTHIPPWTSREDVISEAKAEFDGPVHAVVCDESFEVGHH